MSSCAQCEATSGCPFSYLLAPFPPRMDYLLTGNQLARCARACGYSQYTKTEGHGNQGAAWPDWGASPGAGTQHHELSPARAGDVLWRWCLLLPVLPARWKLFWRQSRVYIPIFVLEWEYL